jgi:hypothetical protein
MTCSTVTIAIVLSDAEAWELAQFVKRLGWSEWRKLSTSDQEADLMRSGCEKLSLSLEDSGYKPR